MKAIRKSLFWQSLFTISLVACFGAISARAQTREANFISARAGGVNFVSGKVEVRRSGETAWQKLTAKDDLDDGDVLKTGADGRAEALLNPGSYVRLAENSQLTLTSASLDELRLKLTEGSAIIEATGYGDDKQALMTLDTPHTEVAILRGGLYRFDVEAGASEVFVHKGRATLGAGGLTLLKGGQMARVAAGSTAAAEVAKFDKKDKDALDLWSKERARELAKVNDKLSNKSLNSMFATTGFDTLWSRSTRFQSAGLWIYNTGYGCYTFVPYYGGWSSPYGARYASSVNPYWWGANCGGCPNRNWGNGGNNRGNASGTGGNGSTGGNNGTVVSNPVNTGSPGASSPSTTAGRGSYGGGALSQKANPIDN